MTKHVLGVLSLVLSSVANSAYAQGPKLDQLALGAAHSCGILQGGTVKCWGANQDGQLGLGDVNPRGVTADQMGAGLAAVSLSRPALAILAGSNHTCAILDDNQVRCWGKNDKGQLGLGDTSSRGNQPNQMGNALPAVNLGTGRTALQLSVGDRHACARLDNGSVKCWGDNTFGQLGLGDVNPRGIAAGQMGDALPAVNLGNGRTAKQISVGAKHSCALLDNDRVKCWGDGELSQLGYGDRNARGIAANQMGDALPFVDLGQGRIATLTAGFASTCVTFDDGVLKCWGFNRDGRLGVGDLVDHGGAAQQMGAALPAVNLGVQQQVVGLTCGARHCCVRLVQNTAKCWGVNRYGELGLEEDGNRGGDPVLMGDDLPFVNLGDLQAVEAIAAGGSHTCAILSDGTGRCWGKNDKGQLGAGDTVNRGTLPGSMGDELRQLSL